MEFDGIILIDKPKGWSSFDVVAKIRGTLRKAQKANELGVSHLGTEQASKEERAKRITDTVGERRRRSDAVMDQEVAGVPSSTGQQGKPLRKVRVGHTGTLDPLATGLMIIVVGSYCKRAQEFSKLDKTYEVTMKLGQTSTTGDEEGEKTIGPGKKPTKEHLQDVLQSFVGESMQTPPVYSAIKVNGQRAYKLARSGKEVILEPRKINIYNIGLTDYAYPNAKFTVSVSSGTYIRSLVEDIGKKLKTGAYMSALRRTIVGEYGLSSAHKPDVEEIKEYILN